MDEDTLTLEQQFLLQRLQREALAMDREQLVGALFDAWAARFRLKQAFISMSQQAGFVFRVEERHPWRQPESDEEFYQLFGYLPSMKEREAYLRHQHETATMELDMEAIVLTADEDE